jgi:hypothetical protein
MKKLLFASTLFLLSTIALAQDFNTPVAYLEYINKQESEISKNMWKYTKTIAHSKSARKIDATRKNLVKTIQNAKNNISKIKDGYKGDIVYRDQVVKYLSVSEIIINEEYSKIVDMQEVAEQSYDFMEAYIMTRDLVNKKMDDEHQILAAGQKEFAKKYNITLTESDSELSKKMKLSNEVFAYHTEFYLIFFKCNITDLMLSKAIEQKDIASIQQNASSLLAYAEEGLQKLNQKQPYKNDKVLIETTKKSMELYQKTATEYASAVIDFFMFNTKFEEAKTSLERKKPNERTKEEVDNYNVMVKEINKKINDYNKINTKFVQEKNNMINQWNTTGDQFISRYVPND